MVASLKDLTNPDDALGYYEADDYYVGDAKAPSAWYGRGAAKLGLRGEVEPDTFADMLHGRLPLCSARSATAFASIAPGGT